MADTTHIVKKVVRMPVGLANRLAKASKLQGISQNSLVLIHLDRGLAKYRVDSELEDPADVATEWPSGWPVLLKCNRCDKVHDPMDHALNKGLLAEARSQAGLA